MRLCSDPPCQNFRELHYVSLTVQYFFVKYFVILVCEHSDINNLYLLMVAAFIHLEAKSLSIVY